MDKSSLYKTSVITAILGAIFGLIAAQLHCQGAFRIWRSLGNPPAMAAKIITTSWSELCVEDVSGKVYCLDNLLGKEAEWIIKTPQPPRTWRYESYFHSPSPPGKVVDYIETILPDSEIIIQANYAILEDGSVWEWRFSGCQIAIIYIAPLFCCGGAMMGFITSPLLVLLIRSKMVNDMTTGIIRRSEKASKVI
jgi:hypothetical protein